MASDKQIKYVWHPNVRRYRGTNGRFVPATRVKRAVDKASQTFSEELRDRTQRLKDDFHPEDFYTWVADTRKEIQQFHNGVVAVALGGIAAALKFATTNSAVWATMEQAIGAQLSWFDRYVWGIVVGTADLDPNRASMYPLAGYGMYQNAVRIREATNRGYDEEQRVLTPGNNCDTCVNQASLGWQPLGTLNAIGDSECGGRCRCDFIYRNRSDDEDENED